jgi:hypothetical protein
MNPPGLGHPCGGVGCDGYCGPVPPTVGLRRIGREKRDLADQPDPLSDDEDQQ